MKEWLVSYTYLETLEAPDSWTYDEVMKWAQIMRPADGYDDIKIFEAKRSNADD